MKPAGKSPRAKKNRRTIGLLIGRLGDIGYAANVWPGVADAAEERDANLVCFVGGALNALHEFDLQRNVIYDLAGPENVEGLVAMSGSIGQFVGPERVLRYYDRFRPLPMISVAMALEGFPAVLVDNAAGVREAITHLVEVHGFRRIAFIRGPATNTEAEERFRAYREVLDAHRLPFDPDLVAEGNYLAPAGMAAVHRLLDERKVRFDAIASANDEMAIGAMTAIRERGMRVPDDMCVTGFDNLEEARFAAPPLTTIRQPLYEQGRKAAELLLDLLEGKEIPKAVVLPTELVIRQSCGCFPRPDGSISAEDEALPAGAANHTPAARRRKAVDQLTAAAGISTPGLEPGWQARLLDSLSAAVEKKKSHGMFLHAWDDTLRRVGAKAGDVMQWHRVLSVLRRQAPPAEREDLELLWRQAESLIGDVAQWSQVHRRLQANRRAFDFMTSISEPLMTAFDIPGLADVVAEQLPRMGVRSCYLSLYEKPDGPGSAAPTAWSRLILAYNESGRVKLPPDGMRFPSRMLVPKGVLPGEKRYALMLEPLHFRDESQLGFLLLEPLQTEVGAHREALSRQISTALKGAILLQERKQAEQLLQAGRQEERRFQERLRTLLEINNELSRAESVDALCRQAVEFGLSKLGFDRMGIWFHKPDLGVIEGSFGTDAQGGVIDERGIRVKAENSPNDILRQTHPVTLMHTGVPLWDGERKTVGSGTRAEAAMWDGVRTIGLVAVDNLLRGRPITDYDGEILNAFASSLGYLCSRKQADDLLRASERKEREFQERLRTLLEISNELSRAESVDALCRQAVELGRARLGFDRLGIWFYSPDPGVVRGSFGTDRDGNIVDEREILLKTEGLQMEILKQTRPIAMLWPDVMLRDGQSTELGRGMQAQAAMWNGEKVIGFISADNLLRHRPVTEQDCELLNLFASSLGYLASRKQAEEALREYSENLEEKVEERTRALHAAQENLVRQEKLAVLGQLTATVSHELRNPLATIRVSATAVDMKIRDRGLGVERALDRIQRNITRCDTIISELLDYTRLPDLDRQTIDFDDWLNRLLDEQPIPEGITLRRDLASGARVRLDGERFQRAIINLLDNARQAMQSARPGGVAAGVLTVESKQEADRLKITIRDTGGGIPPEVLPRIFEPLFSTKGFGVGLGLSIVKGIVEQHGGTIDIASSPGRGTTAVVLLPLSEHVQGLSS